MSIGYTKLLKYNTSAMGVFSDVVGGTLDEEIVTGVFKHGKVYSFPMFHRETKASYNEYYQYKQSDTRDETISHKNKLKSLMMLKPPTDSIVKHITYWLYMPPHDTKISGTLTFIGCDMIKCVTNSGFYFMIEPISVSDRPAQVRRDIIQHKRRNGII